MEEIIENSSEYFKQITNNFHILLLIIDILFALLLFIYLGGKVFWKKKKENRKLLEKNSLSAFLFPSEILKQFKLSSFSRWSSIPSYNVFFISFLQLLDNYLQFNRKLMKNILL